MAFQLPRAGPGRERQPPCRAKAAEDSGRGDLYKTWTVPAKVEQTLSGALRLGQELQDLRRAHITLQEAHMQLRYEHTALQEHYAAGGPHATLHEALDDSESCVDGVTDLDSVAYAARETKDYQVRGMLQKLTHVSEPLEHQTRPNVSHPPREYKNARAAPLWASPSHRRRRSQSVTSLRECESIGNVTGSTACAAGVDAPTASIPVGTTFGPSGSNSAASLRHLSTAGRMALTSNTPMTDVARISGRPGTSERAAMRDALSELLAGAGGSQRRPDDRTFGARCRSH